MNLEEEELLKHLNYLTAIRPFRNFTNRDSLKVAADYIENEFSTYGFKVSQQKWNVGTAEYSNIIAVYKPEAKKKLIVGAHYDVYSNQPGADDNTSGVAGLLFLAKRIAELKPDLQYGIEFVSFCLEEPPHFGTKNMGSYVHAKSLKDSNADIVGMVCLDMIAFFSDAPNSQHYPKADFANGLPTVGNYIAIVGHLDHSKFSDQIYKAMKTQGGVEYLQMNFPNSDGLAGLSDHRNYWYFGYDAVMINDTAKLRNPNYHKESDTVDTLDIPKMNAVVNAVLHAISNPIEQSEPKKDNNKPAEDKRDEKVAPVNDRIGLLRRFFMWLGSLFRKK